VAQALGIVHVLISSEAAEDGLPEQPGQGMPAIPPGAFVSENLASHVRQPKRVVEFAMDKQPRIGGHDRTAKLQHHATVEIDPESSIVRFTRWVRHDGSLGVRASD
jgi:hypothetical protein